MEKVAWIAGAALLGAYGGMYYWSLHARAEGILALQQAKALVQRAADDPSALSGASTGNTRGTAAADSVEPDTATWSAKRIAAYRQALLRSVPPEALLRIPALKLTVPIFEGTSSGNLNRGAGRISGTARFTGPGNIGIAGHRDGFFRPLQHIRVGDAVYVDTVTATVAYRVTTTKIVAPSDVTVLDPTLVQTITLVTCYPFYYVGAAPLRFIVHAERIRIGESGAAR